MKTRKCGNCKGTGLVPDYRGNRVGQNNKSSKLTDEEARAIRRHLTETTMSACDIAKLFGVSQSTVSHIGSGKSWRHV